MYLVIGPVVNQYLQTVICHPLIIKFSINSINQLKIFKLERRKLGNGLPISK